jgi:hypothetical protein
MRCRDRRWASVVALSCLAAAAQRSEPTVCYGIRARQSRYRTI